MILVLAIVFWVCAALIVYTHAGYPLALRALLARAGAPGSTPVPGRSRRPSP